MGDYGGSVRLLLAYGKDRSLVIAHDLFGTGLDKGDRFAIQAVIPEGSVNYTALQLINLRGSEPSIDDPKSFGRSFQDRPPY